MLIRIDGDSVNFMWFEAHHNSPAPHPDRYRCLRVSTRRTAVQPVRVLSRACA